LQVTGTVGIFSIMKTILSILLLSFTFTGFAQSKTEKFNVNGECGTCKKKIETAAKKAGATYAAWDADTKVLAVTYNTKSSSTTKIQQSIAHAGYDTPGYKATDSEYDKLDDCCKYDRAVSATGNSSCDNVKCQEMKCMKDGKCAKDMACCKDSGCDKKDCCKH
jgi:mercuric ion binding protein